MPNHNRTRHCPRCGAEIDHLNYDTSITLYGWEYGSADFDGSFEDTSDSGTDDSEYNETSYLCPECEYAIGTEDNWDEIAPDADAVIPIEKVVEYIDNNNDFISIVPSVPNGGIKISVCPNCGEWKDFEHAEKDGDVICDKCDNVYRTNIC